MKKVASPPRISRLTVDPRRVIWKKESSAPCDAGAAVWGPRTDEGMAHSVERGPAVAAHRYPAPVTRL